MQRLKDRPQTQEAQLKFSVAPPAHVAAKDSRSLEETQLPSRADSSQTQADSLGAGDHHRLPTPTAKHTFGCAFSNIHKTSTMNTEKLHPKQRGNLSELCRFPSSGQDDESSDRYCQVSTPLCNVPRSHYHGKAHYSTRQTT